MANATVDGPVRILATESLAISGGIRVWSAVGIAFQGDRRYVDHGRFGKPFFKLVILRPACGQ
jgi:hypothetical protein